MQAPTPPYLSGNNLLAYLRQIFPNREVISSSELRDFLHISPATVQRMRAQGNYPRTISLPGITRDPRILLIDLAIWLDQGGCQEKSGRVYKKRGRGSETWKKNHPPKTKVSHKASTKSSFEASSDGSIEPSIVSSECTSTEISKDQPEEVLRKKV